MARALIEDIRVDLRRRADPNETPGMQRYMKSDMPYLGIRSREQREAQREVFPVHPLESVDHWCETVLASGAGREYREERYAAIALTGQRMYRDLDARCARNV